MAVLAQTGSGVVLANFQTRRCCSECSCDSARLRYRWHPLFRECMRGEFRRLVPELNPSSINARVRTSPLTVGSRQRSNTPARRATRRGPGRCSPGRRLPSRNRTRHPGPHVDRQLQPRADRGLAVASDVRSRGRLAKGHVVEARHWVAVALAREGDLEGESAETDGAVAAGLSRPQRDSRTYRCEGDRGRRRSGPTRSHRGVGNGSPSASPSRVWPPTVSTARAPSSC